MRRRRRRIKMKFSVVDQQNIARAEAPMNRLAIKQEGL
jgi:hypothetical protein